MTLPYRWYPLGSTQASFTRAAKGVPIEVGTYVAFDHAAWRVTEVRPDTRDSDGKVRHHAVVVPVALYDEPDPTARRNASRSIGWVYGLAVYPDGHYPVCAQCHEPLPCREQMAKEVSAAAAKRADRYSMEGVCPDCLEPVTSRQQSVTWPDNVVIPGGPEVTYHKRRQCFASAIEYEQRWVAADPGRRKAMYTCTGHVVYHGNLTYECTEGVDCPGPQARHRGYSSCYLDRCTEHRDLGTFGCTPPLGSTRVGGDLA